MSVVWRDGEAVSQEKLTKERRNATLLELAHYGKLAVISHTPRFD
jgi:hypothetical protein